MSCSTRSDIITARGDFAFGESVYPLAGPPVCLSRGGCPHDGGGRRGGKAGVMK